MFGIYNTMAKEFQFGICEPTKNAAIKTLRNKIGWDSAKWRFEPKYIDGSPPEKDSICTKDSKLKCKLCVKKFR